MEAILSGYGAAALRRFGGVFAVAAADAERVRVEENAYLGFIDRNRDGREIRPLAAQRWRSFRGRVEAAVASGRAPTEALATILQNEYGASPHTPEQVEALLTPSAGPDGGPTASAWIIELRTFEWRLRNRLEVGTDTFGSITMSVYLIATAHGWRNATPEQWDDAVKAGRVGAHFGQLLGSASAFGEGRAVNRDLSRPAPERPVAAEVRGAGSPTVRGTTDANRATPSRGVAAGGGAPPPVANQAAAPKPPGPASVRPKPSAPARPAAAHAAAPADEDPHGVEAAFAPGAHYGGGGLTVSNAYADLENALGSRLTPRMRAAIAVVTGRFPPTLRAIWSRCGVPEADIRLNEVRRLWNLGTPDAQKAARKLASKGVYDLWRDRFWTAVRTQIKGDATLKAMFDDAGLEFGGESGAPFWTMPDGKKQTLTIDHFDERKADNPNRCVDIANLVLAPSRENSVNLEGIRNKDRFQKIDH